MTKAPWPYYEPPAPGEAFELNEPSHEGRALGRELARFADIEEARQPDAPKRCDECAFRSGTFANGCASTLLNAVKCGIEGETFFCHVGLADDAEPTRPCAGFLLLQRGKAT